MTIDQLRHVLENPDGCDTDDLKKAEQALQHHYGFKIAAERLGAPYSIRGVRILWNYLDVSIMARTHRECGRMSAAATLETVAQDIYKRLPEKLRW